ncbi:gluconokinase [Pseudocolwellia sp. AS88]|uniref:gluconokinase n=1 Tax=Pseudocolwellia sp. AS88 TaxID=3063958 RepID=UPI0026F0F933|nr:gluconokinase [Pseudocolwellia sp. AS88]MDO7086559.1 gluconokinase [Pseudocolwellia sp. AS88]
MIYIVMGVSGCGKSTVGSLLSEKLSVPFYDADDFHFPESIEKMSQGTPLNDEDRQPWLTLLANNIVEWEKNGGAVLACSALKQSYRDLLSSTTNQVVKFIYLEGSQEVLSSRLRNRESHFMPETLLQSQFATLEIPKEAITVPITNSLDEMISEILQKIT